MAGKNPLFAGKGGVVSSAMFLCVSANPAIDKRIVLPSLVPGEIHRARTVENFPGGKSTHVAMVLKALGEQPHWIGMCGGAAGEQVLSGLRSLGIEPHGVRVKSETRTNLEIIADSGAVTEIREPGGFVTPDEVGAFERECKNLFEQGAKSATIIFSGSLPPGAPTDLYARLIAVARSCGCRTMLDASGEALRVALHAQPDFVKPNREEAAGVLKRAIDCKDAAGRAVKDLISLGARSAAVSLGSEGMLYAPTANSSALFAPGVPLKPRSTVGCGDAALAGFAHSIAAGLSSEETLRMATACAAANCLADSPGAVRAEAIREFRAQICVETLRAGP
ncbi:MAG TPA: 1-phosphofructokinase family hexose kinase [Candidatus Acidoferrum sp.]|nr:1-phosphofructokinase family hexose kinase [Candidatus Acidoferrum sp.]